MILTKQNAPIIKHNGYKKYFIHDNMERPFLVYTNSKDIYIYQIDKKYEIREEDINKPWTYTKLVKKYKNTVDIYIGKSQKNLKTIYSGGHGKKFDGNTLLVQLSKTKYVYIGATIYEFTMKDSVVKYFSPIGNSDVPYPIILGTNNVYFMLEKSYIARKYFPVKMSNVEWSEAYDYYYGHDGKKSLENKAIKIKTYL